MKVVVASKNPVKIAAVKLGFEKMFPAESFVFEGISVSSGVPDQPMSDEETLKGATNRAKNIQEETDADYYVGIEGGLEKLGDGMEGFAWVVILSKGKVGRAKTATYMLPLEVSKLVETGMELGHADDVVFKKTNSKQASGATGLLTNDVITRTLYYEQAVILALVPFLNSSLEFV